MEELSGAGAGSRHLIVVISLFQCTTPARAEWDPKRRRKVHDREWELEVQSAVRRTGGSVRPIQTMLVNRDAVGIAAVGLWMIYEDPADYFLQLFAIAVRHRGAGGGYAKSVFSALLDVMGSQARDRGASSLVVSANIHHRNLASQRLFAGAGFFVDGETDADYGRWVFFRDL